MAVARTAARTAPRTALTRAQSIHQRLKEVNTKIKNLKAQREAFAKIMRQSRYTPEGYKTALARLAKYDAQLAKLHKLHTRLLQLQKL